MIRKLLIVFASGLVLATVLLSAAWIVGGQELMARVKKGPTVLVGVSSDLPPSATRTLPFDGAQMLTIDAPVSLKFIRGPKSEMTITGPEAVLAALEWKDGRLSLNDKAPTVRKMLKVTISAPQIAGLVFSGAGDADLDNLDQSALTLDLSGAANIDASGKVARLDVSASGVGDIDLSRLEAGDAAVKLPGAGAIDLAATGAVDVEVSGAGSVTLHRRPANLTSRISGLGSIDHDY